MVPMPCCRSNQNKADHILNMAGLMKTSVRKTMPEKRRNAEDDESVILIAIGSEAGAFPVTSAI